jgi:Phosphotransferase enzyme family
LAPIEEQIETLKNAASELLPSPVVAIEQVAGGRNSRVYHLRLASSGSFALKSYFQHSSENRKRMETEVASLEFLWKGGIRNIPKPEASSSEHGFAIYSWIEGRKIAASDVDAKSIETASDFLCRLSAMRTEPGCDQLPAASEACFSGRAIVENLERRFQRLETCSEHREFESFLSSRLRPAFHRLCDWSRRRLVDAFEHELDCQNRTLSPSDFGFHNALEDESGQISFLDFEYFGWDDPAKTVCDFLLHPGMTISPNLKRQFATRVVQGMSGATGLAERVQAYYPLFGLKWCVILLNEFLPDQLLRRIFASRNEQDGERRKMEQLAKAEAMLDRILGEYEHFSYLS